MEGEESWSLGSNTGEDGLLLSDSWGGEVYNNDNEEGARETENSELQTV